MTKTFVYELVPHHAIFGCNPIQNGYADLLFIHYPEYFERKENRHPTTEPENLVAIRFPDKLAFDNFVRYVNQVSKKLEKIKNKEGQING